MLGLNKIQYLTSLINDSYMTHATPLMVHYKFQNLRTISAEQAHNKDTNLNT